MRNPTPPILIVDDEPGMLELFAILCRRAGHQITTVLRGSDALEAVQQEMPNLVLLDLKLPGVSGLDILNVIRETPNLQHIKVIAITAAPWLIKEAQDSGADKIFTKPVKPAELLDAITELLPISV